MTLMKNEYGIDKFYIIISKKYEADRYIYLQKYFEEHPGFEVEYVDALWSHDVGNIDLSRYNTNRLRIPEIMLIETNIRLFKHILENTDDSYIYICESDIIFQNNFPQRLKETIAEWKSLNEDTSAVFTGNGCNIKPQMHNKVTNTLYKQNASRCADSILFTRKAVQNVLSQLQQLPIIDLPLDHISFYGNDKVISYYLEPHIVAQGSQNNTYKSSLI
jgi:GR25 family glycosyltransferase involved in LPS biosynthesis